jgi:hypothetical protein
MIKLNLIRSINVFSSLNERKAISYYMIISITIHYTKMINTDITIWNMDVSGRNGLYNV